MLFCHLSLLSLGDPSLSHVRRLHNILLTMKRRPTFSIHELLLPMLACDRDSWTQELHMHSITGDSCLKKSGEDSVVAGENQVALNVRDIFCQEYGRALAWYLFSEYGT